MGRVDGLIIPRSYNDYFSRSDPQAIRDLVAASTDDALSSTSENPVQNKVVNAALDTTKQYLAPPTDAVLHYSFDDVPDYPDGTSVYYRNKNFASDEGWNVNTSTESISVSNGSLKIQSLGLRAYVGVLNNTVLSVSNLSTNIIKIRFYCSNFRSVYLQDNGGSYVAHTIFTVNSLGNNWYEAIGVCGSYSIAQTLIFSLDSTSSDNYAIIEAIYIGDGSYSTPIIDNANGQNNATNNGGIATKGVSGKGAYFLNGKYADIGNINLNADFSVSVWVKPDNNTSGLIGNIVLKWNHFILRNGDGGSNALRVYVYYADGTSTYFTSSSLLPVNKWTHIVVTRNGTTLKVYTDGNLIGTMTLTDGTISTVSGNMTVANTSNTRPQSIDDLLIFSRALTETEIMALYLNKANTPKYYSLADYKLAQLESAQTRSVTTEETPSEKKGTETQEEKKDEETPIEDEQQKEQPAEELKK